MGTQGTANRFECSHSDGIENSRSREGYNGGCSLAPLRLNGIAWPSLPGGMPSKVDHLIHFITAELIRLISFSVSTSSENGAQ